MRRLRFVRWVGGPGGHREYVGTARLHRDEHVSVDAALIPFVREARLDVFSDRYLSVSDGRDWFEAAAAGGIYGRGFSVAYGDIMPELA